MRITHLITRLIVGGAQENTIQTVLGLRAKSQWQPVELVSGPTDPTLPEGSLEPLFDEVPNALSIEPNLVREVSPFKDALAFEALYRRFKRDRPDVVHTHSGKAGILGRLAARRAGVPCIIHTIHGPSFGEFQGSFSNLCFKAAEKIAGACTDHFIGVAQAMCRQYLAAGIGTPERYSTIPSGFDLKPFLHSHLSKELRHKLGLEEGDFVIGKVARLFDLKGHKELFEVLPELIEKIPQAKLLLVGGGPLRDAFEHQLHAMGLRHRVVFTGLVSPEEVAPLMGAMDVLVHLSFREGLPRALPQAMAAGKPVIAYPLDGAPEVCLPGQTGYLVPPGDPSALLKALVELAANPETQKTLGQRGRQWVQERFSTESMVESIHQLYGRLLHSARP